MKIKLAYLIVAFCIFLAIVSGVYFDRGYNASILGLNLDARINFTWSYFTLILSFIFLLLVIFIEVIKTET